MIRGGNIGEHSADFRDNCVREGLFVKLDQHLWRVSDPFVSTLSERWTQFLRVTRGSSF